jgi:glucose-1-phosphate thymidylyltransferase
MTPMGIIVAAESPTSASAITGNRGRVPALTRVANRPLLGHVFDDLVRAHVGGVIVATDAGSSAEVESSLAECIDGASIAVSIVEASGPIDFFKAVKMAAPIVGDGPCILHDGSGLLGERLDSYLAVLEAPLPDVVLLSHSHKAKNLNFASQRGLHVVDDDYDVHGGAGVFLLGEGALACLSEMPGGQVDDFAEHIGAIGGSVRVRFVDTWSRFAGSPAELLELNRIALDRLDSSTRVPVNGDNRFEGRVRVHPDAHVESSVIVGPVVIGPGARVVDAYIGPYTSVGEHARIEGVEIERSIVAIGASVVHVGGRISGSVVGPNARVFRDFSLPRAMRLWVGEGDEVALA